jgi:filamentous hemagglutinin family protein
VSQVIGDSTLGAESSLVTSPVPGILQIDGGATRGTNLFHSFSDFSIPSNGIAYFNNNALIQNIISRVTGSSISNIDGLIAANGTANLFLINPNGIIFGSNASLRIGSSFLASTGSSVNFVDGTQFSATPTSNPPLLTISVPLGLQFGGNPGSIQVQGSALQVSNGKTLALVGGNVQLNDALLEAPGGRVELGGLAGVGTIGLLVDGSNLSLSFPDALARADISLNNGSLVSARAGGGGSIAISAENFTIARESGLRTGIASELGSTDSKAGDIEINATGAVNITEASFITNSVRPNAVGNGGDINITAGSFSLTNGARLISSTFGRGDAGNVTITARDTVSLSGSGTVYNTVEQGGVGKGGNITITTGSLSLTDGAQLQVLTDGRGDAGNVTIVARDNVFLSGVDRDGFATGILNTVERRGLGNAGGINITTGSLSLTDGAQLVSTTAGRGNAGSVTITARDTVTLGGRFVRGFYSSIFSNVEPKAVGNGGDINITTGSLSLIDDAQLVAATQGQGNAGNITITARDTVSFQEGGNSEVRSGAYTIVSSGAVGEGGDLTITTASLLVTDGAQLATNTLGEGNAGNLTITARDTVYFKDSSAFSNVESTAVGKGGDINITTASLLVTDGSQLQTRTSGQGNAGNVTITADDTVSFDGYDREGLPSAVLSDVGSGAVGKGGDINITTASLFLTNAAFLSAGTRGQGDGGNITLNATNLEAVNSGQVLTISFSSGKAGNITLNVADRVTLSGDSGLLANTSRNSTANGGDLNITTRQLVVQDGSQVNVSSQGSGNAGSLIINADSITLHNQGRLLASTASGEGGNINLQVQDLILMRRNSLVSAQANNNGNGGNITINAPFIVAVPGENSDIIANAFRGRGGNINIMVQGIYGLESRPQLTTFSDINASSEFGINGTVQINTPDVDPSRGLTELPVEPVNVEVAQGCQAGGTQASIEFFNTGKGGLAPNPYEPLSSNGIWEDVPAPTQRTASSASADRVSASPATPPNKIVEAQGWLINEQGHVALVAEIPATHSQGRCRLH